MDTKEFLIETFDENGELVNTEVVEVQLTDAELARLSAIDAYKASTEALLSSNVAATTKQWVRSQARLMKTLVADLDDLEV